MRIGGDNYNTNYPAENEINKINTNSTEQTGTAGNEGKVKNSSSRFSGIKKFFRNIGHIPTRIARNIRKNQKKAIEGSENGTTTTEIDQNKKIKGQKVSTEKGLKRAYAQLFKKGIDAETANKLVDHLLKNADDEFLRNATPGLRARLEELRKDNNIFGIAMMRHGEGVNPKTINFQQEKTDFNDAEKFKESALELINKKNKSQGKDPIKIDDEQIKPISEGKSLTERMKNLGGQSYL